MTRKTTRPAALVIVSAIVFLVITTYGKLYLEPTDQDTAFTAVQNTTEMVQESERAISSQSQAIERITTHIGDSANPTRVEAKRMSVVAFTQFQEGGESAEVRSQLQRNGVEYVWVIALIGGEISGADVQKAFPLPLPEPEEYLYEIPVSGFYVALREDTGQMISGREFAPIGSEFASQELYDAIQSLPVNE